MINLAKINKDETTEYFKAVETKTYIKTRKKLPKTLKMYLYLSRWSKLEARMIEVINKPSVNQQERTIQATNEPVVVLNSC